jgi:peptidoglycan/LPS O-acetylase OafA/YrhL
MKSSASAAETTDRASPEWAFFLILPSYFAPALISRTAMKRIVWLDVAKGLAILWVVYFHFFTTYFEHGTLPPADWSGLATSVLTILRLVWLHVTGLGFHAVGAFIILSGWALMQSTARRAESGPVAWGAWYRARFLRLYPMYWVAHLVYLISPFVARFEQIDGRIVLSLLGLRFINIGMNFFYLNAAWWYFSMLIQFYVLFPLLFWGARKLGPWTFLLAAASIGFFTRYVLLIGYPQDGLWILGGCALSRLPEFAFGMALGMWFSQSPVRAERFLVGGIGLATGLLLYPAALQLYHNGYTYIFVDFATGACCCLVLVGIAGIISHFPLPAKVIGLVGAFSYGIYLVHHPYVIWLGLRIREQPIWMFLLIALAVMAVLSAWGIVLEKGTNALLDKLISKRKKV